MPSFNRNEKVINNVKRLLPQLTSDEVELIILDNCSPTPVEKSLREVLTSTELSQTKVIRNRANLGMTGNSLRIFEVGEGEFIWSLCDDDEVQLGAIEAVLQGIKANRDSAYLWFPVRGGPQHHKPGRYQGIGAAIQAEPNLFFIALSSCVFRRNFFMARIRIGYLYSYSWASFMCPLLAEMDNETNSVFISDIVVAQAGTVDSNNKWSKLDACLGMRTLLELPMSRVSRECLRQSIDSFTFSTSRLFLDSAALHDSQRWELFRIFLARRYPPLSPQLMLWLGISAFTEAAPELARWGIKFIERLLRRPLLLDVEDRFERS
jgi:glycosyltransferase involved in cell wall biosynthesis